MIIILPKAYITIKAMSKNIIIDEVIIVQPPGVKVVPWPPMYIIVYSSIALISIG